LRIALIIYGTLETLSGGYLYDRMLVDHLRAQGDQVEVISIPWRDYPRHLLDNFSQTLYRRLIDSPVDILLQDELNHPSLFQLNRSLSRDAEFKIISIVHHLRSSEVHPNWQNQIYRSVERRYLQSVDGFIYNSKSTRQVVENLIGGEKPNIVAYPAGDRLHPEISEEQIAGRAKQDGPLQLLFLGNLIPRKGLHFLLDALIQIPKDRWYLTVVGSLEMDGYYADRITRSVIANGFEGVVHFSGPLVRDDLKNVMRSCHLMVIPSSYEGFGIAYLEGMGYGLPAIASTAGGASEIITHGVDGFLLTPENPTLLSGNLSQLIEDRELLTRMSLAATNRYACHPTWEDTTSRIRFFLENVDKSKEAS
jgi:glycosyltransferase involved in cell wall biosynthesis